MSADSGEVQEKRIYLSPRHYVTISVLIVSFLWVIGATYLLIEKFEVAPLKSKLQRLRQKLLNTDLHNTSLSMELSQTKSAYKELILKLNKPALLQPSDNATVVGKQITLKWDYKEHNPYQKYIIEIKAISASDSVDLKFNSLNPEKKLMNVPSSILSSGHYIWRVVPGYLLKGQKIVQGEASNYGSFTLYESVINRIRSTKKIRVGTSPTLKGKFNFVGDKGDIIGFDIDLIQWIADELTDKLKVTGEISVEIVDVPWDELLSRLQHNELDVVISSMTSTRGREESYKGIRFSDGYFESHQIFIQNQKGDNFPKGLFGNIVGVAVGTTNEETGKVLAEKFKFRLDNSYDSCSSLFGALEKKQIDFALVDDILVADELGNRFYQYGKVLDQYLKSFYTEKHGRDIEKYAIAVIDESPNEPNLLNIINELLGSDEGHKILLELNERWIQGKSG